LTKLILVSPGVTQDRRSWFDRFTTNGLILVPFTRSVEPASRSVSGAHDEA